MMKTFFGLDPSFGNFGVAAIRTDGHQIDLIQTWQISTSSKVPLLDRISFIKDSLNNLISGVDPTSDICIEQPFPQAGTSAMLYSLFVTLMFNFQEQNKRVVAFHNSQAHYLIPGTRGIRKSADIKKAAIKAFQDELNYQKRVKSDSAEAYYIAKHGSRFWNFLDGNLTWEDLNDLERDIYLSDGWNTKKTMRKGMIYRPGDCYWDWSREFVYVTDPIGNVRLSTKQN